MQYITVCLWKLDIQNSSEIRSNPPSTRRSHKAQIFLPKTSKTRVQILELQLQHRPLYPPRHKVTFSFFIQSNRLIIAKCVSDTNHAGCDDCHCQANDGAVARFLMITIQTRDSVVGNKLLLCVILIHAFAHRAHSCNCSRGIRFRSQCQIS